MNKRMEIGKKFGHNAHHYVHGRKGYCQEFFDLFKSYCGNQCTILDVGCGTGISTGQLWHQGYHVIVGSDIDAQMLEIAKKEYPQLSFVQADTARIADHFQHHFDVVTAFGSFHWFCTDQAVTQIKQVLKKDGLFFIVNKQDDSDLRHLFITWLETNFNIIVQPTKKGYSPAKTVQLNGFEILEHKEWPSVEIFSFQQAVSYFQSLSVWSDIPFEKRNVIQSKMHCFIDSVAVDNAIIRPIKTTCLVAAIKQL